MVAYLSDHIGVHDHGFNNVSTYGNLLRMALQGRFDASEYEIEFYRMALMASGGFRHLPILNDSGALMGIVSATDILAAIGSNGRPLATGWSFEAGPGAAIILCVMTTTTGTP